MHRLYRVLLCASLLAPMAATAAAQQPSGGVSAYLSRTDIDFSDARTDDGVGPGVRAWVNFGMPFAYFEYQTVPVDIGPVEVDVDSLRLGGGAGFKVSDPLHVFGKLEYVSIDVEAPDKEDGIGLHGGVMYSISPKLEVFGSLGYLMLNHSDGPEINGGAMFHFTKQLGVWADIRNYMGSHDQLTPDDFEIVDFRVGGAFSWGM